MHSLPLAANLVIFALAGVTIILAGTRLAFLGDRLADRTGLGEAITGAILLGAATSLPGITTSIVAAWDLHPRLAMSNALGGIAAQTAFLAVADFFYRRANLEHAAASVPNLLNGVLLTALLGGVLLAASSPDVDVLGIHPITILLFALYVFGMRLVNRSHHAPLWRPSRTKDTKVDVPIHIKEDEPLSRMWGKFALHASLLAGSGWVVAQTGMALVLQTGLTESLVGVFFTAVATSTPELVVTIAAVRAGALTLAVGGILGGNAFDVMFAVAADVAYRPGSIYHQIGPEERFLCALGILMTSVLVAGMIARERKGPAGVGFESVMVLALYLAGFLVIAWGG